MLATTAWSYCPLVGVGTHAGIAPTGALFQGKPPTPLCPLTDPRWKRGGSKSVMEAAATPPGSRAKLTNVASTPTIAARGARRVRRLESRTATPLSGEHDGPDRKSPDLGVDLTPVLHGRSTYRGGPASCRSQGRRMVPEAPVHQPHNNVADRAWAPRAALNARPSKPWGSASSRRSSPSTLDPRQILVLPAPRPAVVLIRPNGRERLTASTTRPFGNWVATPGGVQALTVTLPVLPLGECEARGTTRSAHPERLGASRKRQAA